MAIEDVIRQLEATPQIIESLIEGLDEADVHWKPAPDRFSVAEVLEHLSHAEAHAYRVKLDLMTSRDDPEVEPYETDSLVASGQYSGRDPEESFAHFDERREDNLEFLRSLPAGFEKRTGRHRKLGRITIAELMNEWACHDLGHIRQIAELVRARKFHPHTGPYAKDYDLKP